jgi:hypothetical protein
MLTARRRSAGDISLLDNPQLIDKRSDKPHNWSGQLVGGVNGVFTCSSPKCCFRVRDNIFSLHNDTDYATNEVSIGERVHIMIGLVVARECPAGICSQSTRRLRPLPPFAGPVPSTMMAFHPDIIRVLSKMNSRPDNGLCDMICTKQGALCSFDSESHCSRRWPGQTFV